MEVEGRLCLGCNEPIPEKRLAAKPNAETCITCQQEIEQRPKPKVKFRATDDLELQPMADWTSIRVAELIEDADDTY